MKTKKITLPKATQREMLKFFAQAFERMAAKETDTEKPTQNTQTPVKKQGWSDASHPARPCNQGDDK